MDAISLQAITQELGEEITGLRIEKVQQPARDTVILLLRGSRRLLLHAGANAPRIQLTALSRDNPAQPPMFCMLLRKHLAGAKIASITQPALERLVQLEVDIIDELGQPGKRTLVLEAMGRRSNLILLDGEGRIIECMRRVDAEMSPQRQVLPGLFYQLPPATERLSFLQETEEGFYEKSSCCGEKADGFLLDHYFGLSPLMARELVYRATGETDRPLEAFTEEERACLWKELEGLARQVEENRFTPTMLLRQGRPMDFTCIPIRQYGAAVAQEVYPTFSQLLDAFYETREQLDRVRQRGAELIRAATTARDRMRRKLAMQEKDYAQTQDRDKLRMYGDLITSNLYRMKAGEKQLKCENFYEADCPEIAIPLDPLLTPQQNAAKYYKRYTKAKTAEQHLQEQMAIARRDLEYLESVLGEIDLAEQEQDFLDIRTELREAGFLRQQGKKTMDRPLKPRQFKTSSGFRVLVGRNNRQNDKLTLKDADHRDLWFHTQKIHGSHVILCTEGRAVDDDTIVEAAKIAAWYSQGRDSGNVPVDYTPVKNVKKPAGGRPGMVIYHVYNTVNVTADKDFIKERAVK